ncbi:MAG: glycoside hydrolase family 2 protein [Mobilitalea sp.]
MKKQLITGNWSLELNQKIYEAGNIPVSMYSVLIKNKVIDHPYYRENEAEASALSENDCSFITTFIPEKELLDAEEPTLCFEMIDTLAEVFLNGKLLGKAINMHRVWKFSVKGLLQAGKNELLVKISSPSRFIKEKNAERALWGVNTTMPGYQYIRKAHYMFGWDWGPQLPDMGIYRCVYLYDKAQPYIEHYKMKQIHEGNRVLLSIKPEIEGKKELVSKVKYILIDPSGKVVTELTADQETIELRVEEPQLWWPKGYGEANLYQLSILLLKEEGEVIDRKTQNIGLRRIELSREKDEWGQEFCFKINGNKIFAMGADYIPEDSILPNLTKEKTFELLKQCTRANYNCIRVWGGGYYPEDWFYDICDELGLIVWQDHLFACAVYHLTDDFKENIRIETMENIKRLCNHPSLGLWCGNNEMETAWECWGIPQEKDLVEDYEEMFEHLLRSLVEEYDGVTPYWPSSPSSGSKEYTANDFNHGDVHYWDVWHGLKPMEDVKNHYFRFCSEYGFESMPNRKTLDTVLLPEDCNLYSPVMENHQKCESGNQKLMFYLSEYLRMPSSFNQLIYATQLLQAEAIRMNVEHMRRNRGRCMGSIYWQLNDTNPVISWSAIDYHNRWKALLYFSRRFYAPILLSAVEGEKGQIQFYISNETRKKFQGEVTWRLRDTYANVIMEGKICATVEELSAKSITSVELKEYLTQIKDRRRYYVEYSLESDNERVMGSVLQFVPLKHFEFQEPRLQVEFMEDADEYQLIIQADAYAKDVYIDMKTCDGCFQDNWFDVHSGQKVRIKLPKNTLSRDLSLEELKDELVMMSVYDIGK